MAEGGLTLLLFGVLSVATVFAWYANNRSGKNGRRK